MSSVDGRNPRWELAENAPGSHHDTRWGPSVGGELPPTPSRVGTGMSTLEVRAR